MPLKNDLLDGFELGTIFGDFRELMQYFRVGDMYPLNDKINFKS